MKKIWAMMSILVLTATLAAGCTAQDANTEAAGQTAADDYGAAGAILYGQKLSVEDMLNYAIEDEYLARQTYADIMADYGEVTPFSNIILAEEYHIELLTGLFESYGYTMPKDQSAAHESLPRSFEEALQTGAVIEEDNIAMYEMFLAVDLPDDVSAVFEELKAASENHLTAFQGGRGNGGGQ